MSAASSAGTLPALTIYAKGDDALGAAIVRSLVGYDSSKRKVVLPTESSFGVDPAECCARCQIIERDNTSVEVELRILNAGEKLDKGAQAIQVCGSNQTYPRPLRFQKTPDTIIATVSEKHISFDPRICPQGGRNLLPQLQGTIASIATGKTPIYERTARRKPRPNRLRRRGVRGFNYNC